VVRGIGAISWRAGLSRNKTNRATNTRGQDLKFCAASCSRGEQNPGQSRTRAKRTRLRLIRNILYFSIQVSRLAKSTGRLRTKKSSQKNIYSVRSRSCRQSRALNQLHTQSSRLNTLLPQTARTGGAHRPLQIEQTVKQKDAEPGIKRESASPTREEQIRC
jgi:hypothetical protein